MPELSSFQSFLKYLIFITNSSVCLNSFTAEHVIGPIPNYSGAVLGV